MRNRYYQGPVTDHFDGTRFFMPGLPPADKSLLQVLQWKMLGQRRAWPRVVAARSGIIPARSIAGLQITHIGHASYLIQVAGVNVLVDPVWADRASPLKFAGPRRHNPPAVELEALPPIHALLLTHNHYDHFDLQTIVAIWKRHQPRIVTPLGNDAILRAVDPAMVVQAGDWWDCFAIAESIRVTIVPAYHWSSRRVGDFRMALWGGFVLETPAGVVYCAGDTAYRDGRIFKQIGKRFDRPEVAMLPIGAYDPRWFMQTQHANPEEALQIGQDCGAKQLLGVHWGTFALTDEPFDEPGRLFSDACERSGLRGRPMLPGDSWSL